jgi:hypothetical protein
MSHATPAGNSHASGHIDAEEDQAHQGEGQPQEPHQGPVAPQVRRHHQAQSARDGVEGRDGVNVAAGMPWWWSASEGPGGVAFGALLFVLARPTDSKGGTA